MSKDPGNLKRDRPEHRFAGAIGAGLGCAIALGVGKLIGFGSVWLGAVIVGVFTGLGGFLGQKIASK